VSNKYNLDRMCCRHPLIRVELGEEMDSLATFPQLDALFLINGVV